MTTNHNTLDQFRTALAAVDPASLTAEDRLALLDLIGAAMAAAGLR